MAVYSAKSAAATTQTAPTGWPPGWTWPGAPWPPGWPIDDPTTTPTLTVTAGNIIANGVTTVTCLVLDDGADTDALNYHNINVTAAIGSTTVQLKKDYDDDFADSIDYTISNYTGTSYGFSEEIYFDVDEADAGETVTVTCTVNSVEPNIEGDDDGDVVAPLAALVASTAIYYSLDSGATWAAGSGQAGTFSFGLVGGYGRMFAFSANGSSIRCYESVNGGATWAAKTTITGTNGTFVHPCMGSDGRIVVPALQVTTTYPCIAYSDDGGTTWTVVVVASGVSGTCGQVLRIDDDTLAYIIQGGGSAPFTIYVSEDNGETWGAAVNGFNTSSGSVPRIATTYSGRLLVADEQVATGADWDVYSTDNNGVAWTKRADLGSTTPIAYYEMGSDGTNMLVEMTSAVPQKSTDSGATWAVATAFSAEARSYHVRQGGDWFVGGSAGEIWKATTFPTFALVGTIAGVTTVYFIASPRNE